MLAVSAWHLRHGRDSGPFMRTATLSTAILIPVIVVQLFVGDELGVVEGTYQPMKIAAAESLWNTCDSHCSFSMFQIGGGKEHETPYEIIAIPDLLSILATNHLDGKVQGMNQLQSQYEKKYGRGSYIPNVFIQYWSMRLMAYLGVLVLLIALASGWLIYRKRLEARRGFLRIATWAVVLAFILNTAGWLLTENGRQPWIVQGLMTVQKGVSPSVSATDVWISLILFVVLYAALGVVDAVLMIRYSRRPLTGPPLGDPEVAPEGTTDAALVY
jgi:cytochrome d ubiquinol oxidase subunit I